MEVADPPLLLRNEGKKARETPSEEEPDAGDGQVLPMRTLVGVWAGLDSRTWAGRVTKPAPRKKVYRRGTIV